MLCFAAPDSPGQRREYSEYEVKAAYLLNFAKFTEWPNGGLAQSSTFRIGILGDDPFGKTIDDVTKGKFVLDKPVEIVRADDVEDVTDCAIVFISESKERDYEDVIASLQDLPILTVGEVEQHCETGGIIRFKLQGANVRFDINVEAANRADLKLSSKLLSLATIVG